jgi:small membrane protein
MITQLSLTVLLVGIVVYAGHQRQRSPVIAGLSLLVAVAAIYLVWMPTHASDVAQWAGIGRGVDLIIYLWVVISLLVALNLHVKMRLQLELITILAREIALARTVTAPGPAHNASASPLDLTGLGASPRDQEQSAQDDTNPEEKARRQRLREYDPA